MKTESHSINDVLAKNATSFFIPPFQRAYAWDDPYAGSGRFKPEKVEKVSVWKMDIGFDGFAHQKYQLEEM